MCCYEWADVIATFSASKLLARRTFKCTWHFTSQTCGVILPDRCYSCRVRLTTHLPCVNYDRRQRTNTSGSTIVDRTVKFCRTHFYVVIWRNTRHDVLNVENSRPLIFRLFTEKLERSWWRLSNRHSADDVERLRLLQSPTFVAVVVELTTAWPLSARPDVTLLYNYTKSSPIGRWLHGSDNVPSSPSSTPCRWPPGFDNVPPSLTHQRRHGLLTLCRDSTLRPPPSRRLPAVNDDKLVPTPTAS